MSVATSSSLRRRKVTTSLSCDSVSAVDRTDEVRGESRGLFKVRTPPQPVVNGVPRIVGGGGVFPATSAIRERESGRSNGRWSPRRCAPRRPSSKHVIRFGSIHRRRPLPRRQDPRNQRRSVEVRPTGDRETRRHRSAVEYGSRARGRPNAGRLPALGRHRISRCTPRSSCPSLSNCTFRRRMDVVF
jgi:hypothetical protein